MAAIYKAGSSPSVYSPRDEGDHRRAKRTEAGFEAEDPIDFMIRDDARYALECLGAEKDHDQTNSVPKEVEPR
jgi:hypothetical protein